MNLEINIRKAAHSDCISVYALAKEMATSFNVERNSFELSFSEIIDDESAICLVGIYKDEIVTYLIGFDHKAFYANGRVSWVEEIFVKDELRREGVGRLMMEKFEEWCIERESKLIGLATRRAADFYKEIGYEESAVFFRKLINK